MFGFMRWVANGAMVRIRRVGRNYIPVGVGLNCKIV